MTRCMKMLLGSLLLAAVMPVLAQDSNSEGAARGTVPDSVQIVALDECDPTTFNAALGADFCRNVSLPGFTTTFTDLFAKAASGHPDANWDFEPDIIHVKAGGTLRVVDQ